jgi:mRNA-degrading endonuclease toxin of MazEF toxin-antitoxin module
MVTVVRGDVILCDLNPVIGTEQAGVRPALVVQIDRANTVLRLCAVKAAWKHVETPSGLQGPDEPLELSVVDHSTR